MLLKIAIRNISRSARDYAIYFVTLMMGVALFYAFNSIGSQSILYDIEAKSTERIFEFTSEILAMFSVVIAAVLAFLVLYSNRFLIKRRKKEFGTYLLLGMTGTSVSFIVLVETILVGSVSLIVGLILGFAFSQLLVFLTSALFELKIIEYTFVFSQEAFLATLGCFAIIFVIVGVFNVFSVNRYKLINLLRADEKNERQTVRNPWVCLVVFILAIAVIIYAYQQLIESGLVMLSLESPEFVRATIAMLVGTLMFFWSLAGFVIAVITRLRGVYLRGLTMFTVRQIASRINTAFLSLWAVCVLLFFSITTFSTGMGFMDMYAGDAEAANPYDGTVTGMVVGKNGETANFSSSEGRDAQTIDIAGEMEAVNPTLWEETVRDHVQIDTYYVPNATYDDLFAEVPAEMVSDLPENTVSFVGPQHLNVIPLSQINATLRMLGENEVELEGDQALMVNNFAMTAPISEALAKKGATFQILDDTVQFKNDVLELQIMDNAMLASTMNITVPDAYIEKLKVAGEVPQIMYMNAQFNEYGAASDDSFMELIEGLRAKVDADNEAANADSTEAAHVEITLSYTAFDMITQAFGLRMMIVYLAVYIGIIFLMSTATIIAIQQLSDATDSLPRYRMLSQIGCDRKMLHRSVLIQVLVYFLAPLGLAISHSVCAIGVLNDQLFSTMNVSTIEPILLAGCMTLIIYGGYMLITYLMNRSIVGGVAK